MDSSSRFSAEVMLGEISSQVLDKFWIVLISWNVEFIFSTKRENAGVLGAYTSLPLHYKKEQNSVEATALLCPFR